MIQRIHTVFLLCITTLSALLFFLPIFEFTLFQNLDRMYITTLDTWIMSIPLVLNSIVTLLAITCIFLFKNRPLQIKLCTYMMINSVLLILVFIYMAILASRDTLEVNYKFTLLFPLFNLGLAIAARKSIKKDAQAGGEIAGGARRELEKRLGRSVVSKDNFLPQKKTKKALKRR